MRASATIAQGELIGLKARVVKSSNPGYVGITGHVIDETRNTLVIKHGGEDKVIVKDATVFLFTLQDGSVVEIEGNAIFGRAEDRVKRKPRRRW